MIMWIGELVGIMVLKLVARCREVRYIFIVFDNGEDEG